jgi:glycosyltransferase involved in cell wall biosynthesis
MNLPVAVSNAGSLPEVVSGRVTFFNPGDVDGIVRAVTDIALGKGDELPMKRFEWSATVDQYLALYKGLVSKGLP